jgi:hypothetical protein
MLMPKHHAIAATVTSLTIEHPKNQNPRHVRQRHPQQHRRQADAGINTGNVDGAAI